jgi:hypothetical protein
VVTAGNGMAAAVAPATGENEYVGVPTGSRR